MPQRPRYHESPHLSEWICHGACGNPKMPGEESRHLNGLSIPAPYRDSMRSLHHPAAAICSRLPLNHPFSPYDYLHARLARPSRSREEDCPPTRTSVRSELMVPATSEQPSCSTALCETYDARTQSAVRGIRNGLTPSGEVSPEHCSDTQRLLPNKGTIVDLPAHLESREVEVRRLATGAHRHAGVRFLCPSMVLQKLCRRRRRHHAARENWERTPRDYGFWSRALPVT